MRNLLEEFKKSKDQNFPLLNPSKDKEIALALCETFQIKTTPTRGVKKEIHWNGNNLGIKDDKASDIFHDIGHFQVAHPNRRFLPEYGLGSDVYFKGPSELKLPCLISTTEQDREEKEASILGILWERFFKLNYIPTMECHGWKIGDNLVGETVILETLSRLEKKGLISETGVPLTKVFEGF